MASAAPTTPMPPGPRLPRFAQTAGFMLAPQRWIDANRRRYGDVVTFSTLFDPCFVMVYDPDLVKQVFQGPADQLRAGEANAPLGPVVGRRSVLLLDGAEHLRQRRLMLPAFHGERMRAYEVVMREAADRAIDAWPVGEPFALLRSMQSLTLEVIMRAVFGVEEEGRREELKVAIRAMIDPVGSRLSVLAMILSGGRLGFEGRMRSFQERRRRVDELIFEEIGRRRASADLEEREDVLSMLLLARDDEGAPMTDEELRDELLTLLVAGHETTATGLAWAFELLLRNPPVLERLQASLRAGESEYMEADDQGGPPPSARHLRRRAQGARGAVPAGPLDRSRPGSRSTRRSARSTAAPTATPSRGRFARSASSAPMPRTPTPGSRSAAARAAAWARASPRSRCGS